MSELHWFIVTFRKGVSGTCTIFLCICLRGEVVNFLAKSHLSVFSCGEGRGDGQNLVSSKKRSKHFRLKILFVILLYFFTASDLMRSLGKNPRRFDHFYHHIGFLMEHPVENDIQLFSITSHSEP